MASAPKIPGLLPEEPEGLGAFRARVDAEQPADIEATETGAQDLPAWSVSGYAALSGPPQGDGTGQAPAEAAPDGAAADPPGIDAVLDASGGAAFMTAELPVAEPGTAPQASDGDGAATPGGAGGIAAVTMGEVFIDDGAFDWSGDIWAQDAESTPLIGLTTFRNDSRFAGIDGSGSSVVIIDTGINKTHNYFAGHIAYSYDFYSGNDADATDYNGHGSNVASIAAGSTGMAPGANIIALKVFPDGSGGASYTDIEEALQWTINNAAAYNIVSVNLSLGAGENLNYVSTNPWLGDEFQTLANLGVVTVAAAGNSYYSYQTQGVSWIAADPNTLAVGAVYDANTGGWSYGSGAIAYSTTADQITPFSQRSTTVMDIFAPGAVITGANAGGSTSTVDMHGTSQAAPHIAGVVALAQELAVQTIGRKLTVAEFTSMLKSSGVSIYDGDNENDNVTNTNTYYKRVDVNALGNAILALSATINGTAGDDYLNYGWAGGSRTIYGNDGNDTLIGSGYNDLLDGGNGNDLLDGANGADVLVGGAGIDTATYANWTLGRVSVNLNDGVVDVAGNPMDTLSGIENAIGTVFGDMMIGSTGANRLDGGAGDDWLFGYDGDDVLVGGAGTDTLLGGAGNDTIIVATQAHYNANETISGGAGIDTLLFTTGVSPEILVLDGARVTGIEAVTIGDESGATTGTANLSIDASAVANALTITGNDGINTLAGTAYADTIYANGGNDTVNAGAGADVVDLGAGNDVILIADAAHHAAGETISGGSGADTVRFTATAAGQTLTLNANTTGIEAVQIADANGANNGTVALNVNAAALAAGVSISGNDGANTITGTASADTMFGNGGNDVFIVAAAADHPAGESIVGGAGSDAIRFTGTTAGQTFTLRVGDSVEAAALADAAGGTSGTTALNLDASAAGNGMTLWGNNGANTITGTAQADTIAGNGGVDRMTGGAGNDVFVFGQTDSSATAGNHDLITDFTTGQDVLDLGAIDGNTGAAGQDGFRFLGTAAFDGQAGALRYFYTAGTDVTTVEGDTNGDGAADFAIDLSGNKTLTTAEFSAATFPNLTPQTLAGTAGADVLTGAAGNDTLTGLGGPDTLLGNGGDDLLNGGGGGDRLDGGSGTDTATYADWGLGRVSVNLNDGVADVANNPLDTLISIENAIGTGFNDMFIGSAGANRLEGGGGDDWMFGYSGADTMLGGAGADELIGGGGADTLTGGGGSDRFVYWNAADSGASAGSRDLITDFTQGQDLLDLAIVDGNTTTGADDPFRFLGTGAFDGQPGALRYGYDSGSGVTVLEADTNGDGTADFAIGLTGNLALAMSDFAPGSAVSGIAQPLTLTGTGGNDVLDGGTLNDTLIGLAGNDTLNGAGGDDTLNGGDGADRLDGGSGSDTVTYADWGMGRVAVNLNDGVADLANSPLDTLISIENAVGTAFGDVFVGSAGANRLDGGAGADWLFGYLGVDTLTGGSGADLFYFGTGDSSPSAGSRDRITDFTPGEDLLDLTGMDAIPGTAGRDGFTWVGTTAFAGQAGELRYAYDSVNGVTTVQGDTDGDGSANFAIDLAGNLALNSGNFTAGSIAAVAGGPMTLIGTNGADVLNGGTADDTLIGLGGDDSLNGGGGNDLLNGGDGADRLDGGAGTDTVTYADWGMGRVSVNLNDGVADVAGSPLDTLISIENAIGTNFNDMMIGSTGANRLEGGNGDDWLFGYDGNDTIVGGAGTDTLIGGNGSDRFEVNSLSATDIIADFTPGDSSGDTVALIGLGVSSFAQVQAMMQQTGADVHIHFGSGSDPVLVLSNTTVAAFNQNDFVYS